MAVQSPPSRREREKWTATVHTSEDVDALAALFEAPRRLPPPDWRERFLRALHATPNVTRAADYAGITKDTAYRERQRNPAFAQAWQNARERAVDDLEEAAFDRAKEVSDTLAIFLLKCNRPEVYRDTQRIDHNVTIEIDSFLSQYASDSRAVLSVLEAEVLDGAAPALPAGEEEG